MKKNYEAPKMQTRLIEAEEALTANKNLSFKDVEIPGDDLEW